MAQLATQARPFARAAFEVAIAANEVDSWLVALRNLAVIASDDAALAYIMNPTISTEKSAALFLDIVDMDVLDGKLNTAQKNFVQLLAQKRQLVLLTEIETLFLEFHARDLQTVNVTVTSAMAMDPAQQAALSAALAERLQKKIAMQMEIDTSLIGGAIISTRDWVIDGSVKGKLQQLKAQVVG